MESVFELKLTLPERGTRKLLVQLHRQVREAILTGRLSDGAKLPSSREFARRFGVSRNTATALYDLLLGEGLVSARVGAGTFVTARAQPSNTPHHKAWPFRPPPRRIFQNALPTAVPGITPIFDLRLGTPELRYLPWNELRRLAGRVLRHGRAQLSDYGDTAGEIELREAIAHHISFTRAVACTPDDIIVTTGAQQAFDLIARTFVEPSETIVAVENPGYPPMCAAFESAGARIHPVSVDVCGMNVDMIPESTRIICATPSHQFPTGAAMSLERRRSLLDFAARSGAIIVEDDYDSEFRYEGSPLDALQTLDQDGAVFYVGTFSKSLFPGVRLGYLVTPPWARSALLDMRRIFDWHSSLLSQYMLADFIREGHLPRHIRKMRKIYRERRHALLKAVQEKCGDQLDIIPSQAGLHIAVKLPGETPADAIAASARRAGLAVESLSLYAAGSEPMNGLALSFARCEGESIADAVDVLKSSLSTHSGSASRASPIRT